MEDEGTGFGVIMVLAICSMKTVDSSMFALINGLVLGSLVHDRGLGLVLITWCMRVQASSTLVIYT